MNLRTCQLKTRLEIVNERLSALETEKASIEEELEAIEEKENVCIAVRDMMLGKLRAAGLSEEAIEAALKTQFPHVVDGASLGEAKDCQTKTKMPFKDVDEMVIAFLRNSPEESWTGISLISTACALDKVRAARSLKRLIAAGQVKSQGSRKGMQYSIA